MKPIILAICLLAVPAAGFCATINVPGTYPTIQAGIDAAVTGDTVLVAPGTYYEIIDFKGKAITVTSSGGSSSTVINAQQSGSVVTFNTGEGLDSVLEGFSLTDGSGTGSPYPYGGAVYCDGTSPTIRWNEIYNNYALNCSGIFCTGGSPSIKHNVFTNNNATGPAGAIYLSVSEAEIVSNIMIGNSAGNAGGAICCDIRAAPLIQNNIIAYNQVVKLGGAIACNGGFGESPVIANNVIYGNTASEGGGVSARYDSSPIIIDTIFWSNYAPVGHEIALGDYTNYPSTVTISYSDVEGGQAQVYVGANCVLNWGAGMIDADPLFFDPFNDDFHLKQDPCQPGITNPCVDTGSDTALNLGFHMSWTRTDLVPDSGVVDMGYHYGEFPVESKSLKADVTEISEATGGTVTFTLDAMSVNAGRTYILLGSITGTSPGTTLPTGKVLPINWDIYTGLVLNLINTTPFQNFLGALDGNGTATAVFNTLGPIPGANGLTMSYAFGLNNPWDFVSNAVDIFIVP